jgi:uncharacterized protein (TIGR03437 family)
MKLCRIHVFVALLAPGVAALAQAPSLTAVANNASFQPRIAPGSVASIFGSNFGSDAKVLSVQVGGKNAYVITASPTFVNIQAPVDAPTGMQSVIVARQGQPSAALGVQVDTHAPGLFSSSGTGTGLGSFIDTAGKQITSASPAIPNTIAWLFATGLGPTIPAVPTGTPSPDNPAAVTATTPRVTVGGREARVGASILFPGMIGVNQVSFTVPGGLAEGENDVILEIGAKQSNTVKLPVGKPVPIISWVANGASFLPKGEAAPSSFVSLSGVNLGSKDRIDPVVFPATEFEGLSVTFAGTAAPLFHVVASVNQINLLTPSELPESGEVTVRVKTAVGTSGDYRLKMAAAVPGIFRIGERTAIVQFANTRWLVLPATMARQLKIPESCSGLDPLADCGQPAGPGDYLVIYTTALGKATPGGDPAGTPLKTGTVAPPDGNPIYMTVQKPAVSIGDVPAEVLFSGLAPGMAGLYQVNIRVAAATPEGGPMGVWLNSRPRCSTTLWPPTAFAR